jgi:hypothetical protein
MSNYYDLLEQKRKELAKLQLEINLLEQLTVLEGSNLELNTFEKNKENIDISDEDEIVYLDKSDFYGMSKSEIQDILSENVVRIVFRKKDGTIREYLEASFNAEFRNKFFEKNPNKNKRNNSSLNDDRLFIIHKDDGDYKFATIYKDRLQEIQIL